MHLLTNYEVARAESRDLLRVFSGTDMSVSHLVSLPPGLLMGLWQEGVGIKYRVLPGSPRMQTEVSPTVSLASSIAHTVQ